MDKKELAIVILIAVIIVLAAALGYFIFIKGPTVPASLSTNNPSVLASSDSGVVDLTVISISKSDYCRAETKSPLAGRSGTSTKPEVELQNEQCLPENLIPSDSETLKVDKIVSYNQSPDAHYKPLQEGNTYNSNLISRPAKFKYVTVPSVSTKPGTDAVAQKLPESGFQKIENGLYSFTFYSDGSLVKEHEVTLPGFKEGDKIRAQVNFNGNLSITEYELLK